MSGMRRTLAIGAKFGGKPEINDSMCILVTWQASVSRRTLRWRLRSGSTKVGSYSLEILSWTSLTTRLRSGNWEVLQPHWRPGKRLTFMAVSQDMLSKALMVNRRTSRPT